MFKSNQQRLKSYVAERRIEEANADRHQQRVYEQIAEDLGDEVKATSLARMAKRVINTVGDVLTDGSPLITKNGVETPDISATTYLTQAIKQGKLSELFTKITKIDPKGLSKKAKIILGDLRRPDIRKQITDSFNEKVKNILQTRAEGASIANETIEKAIGRVFIDSVAGEGGESAMQEILGKRPHLLSGISTDSSSGSDKSPSPVLSPVNVVSNISQLRNMNKKQLKDLIKTKNIEMSNIDQASKATLINTLAIPLGLVVPQKKESNVGNFLNAIMGVPPK